ncbi:MAG: hypothetical protein SFV32_04370 [Opitutaceae bacterium]|nr:hypothetical protein [Opitutaceae bacterium]
MSIFIVGHVQPAIKKSASSLLASDYPFVLSGQQVTPEVKSLQLKLSPVKSLDPLHVSPQQFVDDVLSAPNQTLPGTPYDSKPKQPHGRVPVCASEGRHGGNDSGQQQATVLPWTR